MDSLLFSTLSTPSSQGFRLCLLDKDRCLKPRKNQTIAISF
jgi:hypothetical protein